MNGIYAGYKNGVHRFPKHDIDPKLKLEAEWNKEYCEAMFASWIAGNSGISFGSVSQFRRLRKLAAGNQPIEKYQDILLDTERTPDGKRKGWMNLNWDILSVAPKFMNVIVGMFETQEHDVSASAIDPISSVEREQVKWNLWFESSHAKQMQEIRKNMGVPAPDQSYLPETMQELNLYQDLGGFKLGKETAIEAGLDYTFYISDWKEIKRQLIYDLASIGVTVTKDYIDAETQKVRVRYSDAEKYVCQYSKHNDHRNSTWGGEIIEVPISRLRQETNLTEDQLYEIANKYSGYKNNISMDSYSDSNLQSGDALNDGTYIYDTMMIDVLDGEYISVNDEYKTKRINDRGEEYYFDEQFGKVYDTEKKKTSISKKQQVYRCKLIIGTDHVYDYGYQFDVPRPGKKEVRLSYNMYRIKGRSIIDLSEANLDNLQLAWLKFQNNLAMSSAPGLAVEWSSLQNMLLGGEKQQPMEILTIRRDTGDLVYRATTHRGSVNNPHAGKPVQELAGGMGKTLDEFIKIFEMNMEFIRNITGVNRIADASDPDKEQSVRGSQLAVAATNNVLRPLYSGYISIKERTALNCSLRLQIAIKYNKDAYKGYYPVLGKSNMKLLELGAEVLDADYAFKIEARANEEMKQVVRTAALTAMKPDRDGHVGLEMPDYLIVERLMDLGNLKLAQALISERIRRNKQIQVLKAQEQQKAITDREQQNIQLKEQLDEKSAQREHQFGMELETHKSKLEMEKDDNETENKIKLAQVEAGIALTTDDFKSKQEGNKNLNPKQ